MGFFLQESVEACFEGYNSTVFAYGQTGSGKTFTITGGAERYRDRGIIPRSISEIFKRVSQDANSKYVVRVSYLEIYNNNGYDLLSNRKKMYLIFTCDRLADA